MSWYSPGFPILETELADYTAQLDREYMTVILPILMSQDYGYAMALAEQVVERFLPTPMRALDWERDNSWLSEKTALSAGLDPIERIICNVETYWLSRLQVKWMMRFNESFVVRFDIDEEEGAIEMSGMIPQSFARLYLPE